METNLSHKAVGLASHWPHSPLESSRFARASLHGGVSNIGLHRRCVNGDAEAATAAHLQAQPAEVESAKHSAGMLYMPLC